MGRKRKGLPITGWLVIDKPLGITSNDVVTRVRRATGAAKVGHGGTLDPLATGVLPVALGEATKTVSYAMDGTKNYRFQITFGESRTTDDAEGEVVESSDVRPDQATIKGALPEFIGSVQQTPPIYSAIKVNGQRSYDLARADQAPVLEPRTIQIHDLQLVEMPNADTAIFECTSGKGAYMRALARDIAVVCGTVGHISMLRRTAVGPFTEIDAISLDHEAFNQVNPALDKVLRPVETVLADIPALALTEPEANRLRNGQPVALLPVAQRCAEWEAEQGDIVSAMAGGRMVALARIAGGEIQPVRIIHHETPNP